MVTAYGGLSPAGDKSHSSRPDLAKRHGSSAHGYAAACARYP